MEDMIFHGTTVRGRSVPAERRAKMSESAKARGVNFTKYTKEIVQDLRDHYATGLWSYSQLVIKFQIPKATIAQILTGKTWQDLDNS